MPTSLVLACLWAVTASVLAMRPSRDNHWRLAYLLMAVGVPILGYVTYQLGPWWGLAVLAAGMSVLRWPVIYLFRWFRKRA